MEVHRWTFKIIKGYDWIGIGIDETSYVRKADGDFSVCYDRAKCYAIYCNGMKRAWDLKGYKEKVPLSFTKNDQVEMILDLSTKTLSYKVNDGDKYDVYENIAIGANIEYCPAVWLNYPGDIIELI